MEWKCRDLFYDMTSVSVEYLALFFVLHRSRVQISDHRSNTLAENLVVFLSTSR
jgi:hypothetical protein